jgi:hypothetical protein
MDDKVWIKDGWKPFRLFHKKAFPNPDATASCQMFVLNNVLTNLKDLAL